MQVGDIEIKKLTIGSINAMDPSSIGLVGFNIYEDITNPLGPYGEVIVADFKDLAGDNKLNGKEDITFEFSSMNSGSATFKFKSFKSLETNDGSTDKRSSLHNKQYTIRFVSEEAINVQGNRVSKTFNEPTSSMVEKIVKENFKSKDSIEIGESTKKLSYNFSDKHPVDAIRTLGGLHVGTKSESSLFFLFKKSDGGSTKYVFDSPDNLFSKGPVCKLKQGPRGLGESDEDKQNSILWFQIGKTFDASTRAMSKAQEATYNPATGKPHAPNRKTFKPKVADSPTYDGGRSQDKQYKIHQAHNPFNESDAVQTSTAKVNRADYLSHLAQNYADLEIPGNPKIKLGSIIDLDIPKKSDSQNESGEKQFNGKAMVVAIRHKVKPLGQTPRYTMILRVAKGGFKDGSGGNA